MRRHQRDFGLDRRVLFLAGIAVVIGGISTVAAFVLLNLIRFFTNLFFFQTLSDQARSPADNTLGLWVIVVPVLGGLVIGLMARYGSEKIRGHGIPEAIEAILFGKSKMSPKIAVIPATAPATSKVLRSALVIWKYCPISEPTAPPVMMIGPSAPNGPPDPMEIADDSGLSSATFGSTRLPFIRMASIASGMPWPRMRSEPYRAMRPMIRPPSTGTNTTPQPS